jgi:hypothetical protein
MRALPFIFLILVITAASFLSVFRYSLLLGFQYVSPSRLQSCKAGGNPETKFSYPNKTGANSFSVVNFHIRRFHPAWNRFQK